MNSATRRRLVRAPQLSRRASSRTTRSDALVARAETVVIRKGILNVGEPRRALIDGKTSSLRAMGIPRCSCCAAMTSESASNIAGRSQNFAPPAPDLLVLDDSSVASHACSIPRMKGGGPLIGKALTHQISPAPVAKRLFPRRLTLPGRQLTRNCAASISPNSAALRKTLRSNV